MFSPGNPYNVSEPVRTAERFVGRRDVLAWLWQALALRQRIVIVSGPALIGKSSLLLQAQREAAEEYLAVYVDLSAALRAGETALLAYAIAQAHQRMLAEARVAAPAVSAEAPASVWKALREISPARRPVFFFDHLDQVLTDGGDAGWRFLDELAELMSQRPDVQAVFAVRSADLLKRLDQLPFGRAFQRQLGPLTRAEALRLIREPAQDVLEFDYEALLRIDEWTGRLPYYIQLLCGQLYEQRAAAGHVGVVDLEPALQALGQLPVPPFAETWERAAPEGKLILSLLGSLKGAGEVIAQTEVWTGLRAWGIKAEATEVAEVLNQLVKDGALLRPGATTYRFPVDLFRHWLRVLHPIQATLATHRWQPQRRQPAAPPPSPEAPAETPPARRLSWPFFVPIAAVLIAMGLFAILWPTAQTPAPPPTATPELATLAAMLLAPTPSATPARFASVTPAGPTATPTETTTPTPSPTITPTRPLVLARSIPAIAFMRKSAKLEFRIWLMGADGNSPLALTDGLQEDTAPAWSPDGRRIAFVSKRDGNLEIYVMNADGSNPVNISQHPSDDWTPAWSPDGTEIAFSSRRDGNWEIYVMWADGKDPIRLTNDPRADLAPTWSPDGRYIAFASDRDGDYDIYVMERTGKNVRQLTNAPGNDLSPAWSPDGRYIAFESMRDGRPEIYLMRADGREPINLTKTAGANDHWPTWSPDSARLAFCSNRSGSWDIWVMSLDGTNVMPLTNDPDNDQGPAWRP